MVVSEEVAEGGLANEKSKITMETTDQTDPGAGTGCRAGQRNDGLLRTGGSFAETDCGSGEYTGRKHQHRSGEHRSGDRLRGYGGCIGSQGTGGRACG